MKKRKITILFFIAIILMFAVVEFDPYFSIKEPDVKAKSYILIDAESEESLIGKNEDVPYAAASMTKLMTEYLVLERINNGNLDWDDEVEVSAHAYSVEGVRINVPIGARLTVRDLFNAMVVASANNAAVSLAEAVAGSEEAFTNQMNQKAKELGLSDLTHFVNATGLSNSKNEESQMTARDVSKLAVKLLERYPEILEITKLTSYQLQYDGIVVQSTNQMLDENNPALWLEGVDGLKTGFTDQAGYCFTGTVEQDGERFISVVMGTDETDARFIETKKLFSYGLDRPYIPSVKSVVKEVVDWY
ncbi:D-alanyl-D-alanine carboxypeptidase family protein [Neobacillus sp. K501]